MTDMFETERPFYLFDEDKGANNQDSEFIDELVKEHIDIGGVVVYVYRLKPDPIPQNRDVLGVRTAPGLNLGVDIGSFLGIEDPILGENRSRDYNFDEVPGIRGVYRVSENNLAYAKWGLTGLVDDVLTFEFHIRTVEEKLGRRFVAGDVIELPHMHDVGVDGRISNRWYEVTSVVRASGGYDPMWGYHVLGVIMRPMRNAQEFIQFMEMKDQYGKTLADQASNHNAMMEMTSAIQQIAEQQAPKTLWDNTPMYIDPTNQKVIPYKMTDDAAPPNGIPVMSGPQFPSDPKDYDYFVRTDFYPNRLLQFFNGRWRLKERDIKRDWQPYSWTAKLREFMSDRSDHDVERKWQLKSIHDVITPRHENSDPSPNDDS